ncbi:MAG: hypothetical protein WCW13_04670 [archaeon]|jgi:hypothetical protein
MGEKDLQWGIVAIAAAVIFLLSGLEMLEFQFFDRQFSIFIAFVLVASGIYLIMKK